MNLGDLELARELLHQATDLSPNESEVLVYRAWELCYLAEFDEAVRVAQHARRINPYSPDIFLDAEATVNFLQGRYSNYFRLIHQLTEQVPEGLAWEAAAHAFLGELEEAQRKAKSFLNGFAEIWAGDPSAGPVEYVRWITEVSSPFTRDEDRERLREGLRLAGLPG
jgi:tetratricopeptide (TPR) repeat protein